jgi:hypothetical protein
MPKAVTHIAPLILLSLQTPFLPSSDKLNAVQGIFLNNKKLPTAEAGEHNLFGMLSTILKFKKCQDEYLTSDFPSLPKLSNSGETCSILKLNCLYIVYREIKKSSFIKSTRYATKTCFISLIIVI